MRKGKRSILLFVLAIVLLVIFTVRLIIVMGSHRQLKDDFSANAVRSAYLKNEAIEQIDFQQVDQLIDDFSAPISYELSTTLSAPRDIYYYETTEDDAKPALTINKGDSIQIIENSSTTALTRGYGISTYPTYGKGWRYARPFATEGSASSQMLYVKLDNIEAVIADYYDDNKALSASRTKQDVVRRLSLDVDEQYYNAGIYLSPDYYVKRLVLIDWIVLGIASFTLLLFLASVLRRRKA